MSELKTVQSATRCSAELHFELSRDDLLGDVRRKKTREALARDDLLLDFALEQIVFDEHRGLISDGGDHLEIFLLELRERFRVEPERAEDVAFVQKRHDDRARDPIEDHRFAFRRREIHRRIVREHRRFFFDDVIQDRRRHLNRRVGSVAPARGARLQLTVRRPSTKSRRDRL